MVREQGEYFQMKSEFLVGFLSCFELSWNSGTNNNIASTERNQAVEKWVSFRMAL